LPHIAGSGKSYTIRGEGDEPGLLPRLCRALFTDVISADDTHQYAVRIAYFEVYNERVIDLLAPGQVPPPRKPPHSPHGAPLGSQTQLYFRISVSVHPL
jgi:hypothetical protein